MKAAWYECQGGADDVLQVGTLPDPTPQAGEVRIRLAFSGINPGDVKKRTDEFGYGMSYPRIIPHSDGSGFIDQVGEGVAAERLGERVWCFGAQSYRPFGAAAEYVVVPESHAVALVDRIELAVGATLGIPGIPGITARPTVPSMRPATCATRPCGCRAQAALWRTAPSRWHGTLERR
jgi:NADPH2:quinone reductase